MSRHSLNRVPYTDLLTFILILFFFSFLLVCLSWCFDCNVVCLLIFVLLDAGGRNPCLFNGCQSFQKFKKNESLYDGWVV